MFREHERAARVLVPGLELGKIPAYVVEQDGNDKSEAKNQKRRFSFAIGE